MIGSKTTRRAGLVTFVMTGALAAQGRTAPTAATQLAPAAIQAELDAAHTNRTAQGDGT